MLNETNNNQKIFLKNVNFILFTFVFEIRNLNIKI